MTMKMELDAYPDRRDSTTPASILDQIMTEQVVIIVDPVSTGACLAYHLAQRFAKVVCVWSDMCPAHLRTHTKADMTVAYTATYEYTANGAVALARDLVQNHAIMADVHVMVGCETGVLAADDLAAKLDVRGNGIALSEMRRNKYLQGEAVRRHGLDAPMQAEVTCAEEVERFLQTFAFPTPFKAVVKPVNGAGSDGVTICNSPDEVRCAYALLEGTKNVLGLTNYSVLLQEYLLGDEYVVDTVSRDGEHKCVAIWKYDKREAHGAPVVLFGQTPLGIDDVPELRSMVEYVLGALDALGIRNGASHSEVKLETRGPVLVEVNCRLHGADGLWLPLAQAVYGYTQVSEMVSAYMEPQRFAALPVAPAQLCSRGAWVSIRSNATGYIRSIDDSKLATIRALPSFLDEYLNPCVQLGGRVEMTTDVCKLYGGFNLVNPDAAQLEADTAIAQCLVGEGLFSVAEDAEPC